MPHFLPLFGSSRTADPGWVVSTRLPEGGVPVYIAHPGWGNIMLGKYFMGSMSYPEVDSDPGPCQGRHVQRFSNLTQVAGWGGGIYGRSRNRDCIRESGLLRGSGKDVLEKAVEDPRSLLHIPIPAGHAWCVFTKDMRCEPDLL